MKFLLEFFHQKVPKDRGDTLMYYQQSLMVIDQILLIYFALSLFLVISSAGRFFWLPAVILAALTIKHFYRNRLPVRVNLLLQALFIVLWCCWYANSFGWGYGSQHLLISIILMAFFSLYEPPIIKLAYFFGVLTVRMLLFWYTSCFAPLYALTGFAIFLAQLFNSLTLFLILACCCIIYSSNLQETERQLLLHNEQLQFQAETDPLTKLFNRRYLLAEMNHFSHNHPEAMYCIAIADIDFFKRVNDTYGHNCGDYTLQSLAKLFTELAQDRYCVGRWGGEEFCFFFPYSNIDQAGQIITEVCIAVRRMKLEYEGQHFSITLTAGVEENDYRSPLSELIESADRKLYLGKQQGRDRIVF